MQQPYLSVTAAQNLSKTIEANSSEVHHASVGAELVQNMQASESKATAEDIAALAADFQDGIPAAYQFAYTAEFNEAIVWSHRRSPMAASLRTDTDDSHSAAKVGTTPLIQFLDQSYRRLYHTVYNFSFAPCLHCLPALMLPAHLRLFTVLPCPNNHLWDAVSAPHRNGDPRGKGLHS